MTDFDYYTQFKFSQKEIDMLNFYINYEPAQADKNDAQNYEKKLLEKTNLYYDKAKRLIDDQITTETGLPETAIWKTVIENTY